MADVSRLDCLSDRFDRGSELWKTLLMGAGATFPCTAPQPSFVDAPPGIHIVLDELSNEISWNPDELDWPEYISEVNCLSEDASLQSQSPISKHLRGLIKNLKIPTSWRSDGTELPSSACVDYTQEVLIRLFDMYGVIPYKTAVSKEGGIFAAFNTPHDNNILRIEVDNDLDVIAAVSDGTKILDSGVIEGDDVERGIIRSFDNSLI